MSIDWSALITAKDKAALAAAQEQDMARDTARRYLAETDWYVIRAADTGTSIPDPVRLARAAARDLLSSGISQ